MACGVFVNHTNHASENWDREQRQAAEAYGAIFDLPFPDISPTASRSYVADLAKRQAEKILALRPAAVLCQGEFTYTYALTKLLAERRVPVLAATSRRVSQETLSPDGARRKVSLFRFVQFRQY